jgi:hypothetical protein
MTQPAREVFNPIKSQDKVSPRYDEIEGREGSTITTPILPPPPKKIHHLPRRPTAARMISMRLSPTIITILVRIRELAIILLQDASAAGICSSSWSSLLIIIKTLRILRLRWSVLGLRASALLEVVEARLGAGRQGGFFLAEIHGWEELRWCAGAGIGDFGRDVALMLWWAGC